MRGWGGGGKAAITLGMMMVVVVVVVVDGRKRERSPPKTGNSSVMRCDWCTNSKCRIQLLKHAENVRTKAKNRAHHFQLVRQLLHLMCLRVRAAAPAAELRVDPADCSLHCFHLALQVFDLHSTGSGSALNQGLPTTCYPSFADSTHTDFTPTNQRMRRHGQICWVRNIT